LLFLCEMNLISSCWLLLLYPSEILKCCFMCCWVIISRSSWTRK
jgi:hypothetical protein